MDPGERADVDQVDVVAAGGAGRRAAGWPPGRVHRRRALPGRVQLPGAAAGGGRRLVAGPGKGRACAMPWRRRGAGMAKSEEDPGECANIDQVDVVAVGGDVGAGQVLDARAALTGVLQGGHQASASAPRTTGAARTRRRCRWQPTGGAPGAPDLARMAHTTVVVIFQVRFATVLSTLNSLAPGRPIQCHVLPVNTQEKRY